MLLCWTSAATIHRTDSRLVSQDRSLSQFTNRSLSQPTKQITTYLHSWQKRSVHISTVDKTDHSISPQLTKQITTYLHSWPKKITTYLHSWPKRSVHISTVDITDHSIFPQLTKKDHSYLHSWQNRSLHISTVDKTDHYQRSQHRLLLQFTKHILCCSLFTNQISATIHKSDLLHNSQNRSLSHIAKQTGLARWLLPRAQD